jgi:hypothetical protein
MPKKSLSSSSRVNILSARTSNSSTYNTSTSNCNKRKLSTINVDDEELDDNNELDYDNDYYNNINTNNKSEEYKRLENLVLGNEKLLHIVYLFAHLFVVII